MQHPELLVLVILRTLAEVALLTLLGQGVLALLAGSRRNTNPVYRVFQVVTGPVIAVVRKISPPQIIDKHLPFVAFFVMFWAWIGLAYLKRAYCQAHLLQCL
ncbi:MAG: hypothetical protein RIR70_1629 [Pseudomonadota bacterium]|jgi:uncharacterized protein YggT (Ycf19 family)